MKNITITSARNKAYNGKVILFDENTGNATMGKKTFIMRTDAVDNGSYFYLFSKKSKHDNARIRIDEYDVK